MGSTWQSLLDEFVRVQDRDYRDENDREEALIDQMAFTMQRILEKLRDQEGLL